MFLSLAIGKLDVRVQVKVLGMLRDVLGGDMTTINASSPLDIEAVLDRLLHRDLFNRPLMVNSEFQSLYPNTLILLDGVEINNLQGMKTLIEKDSELVLLSVTHGG